ncbi:MAG: type I-U CRISPR-associated helicase/endonuclease Cas3 [Thauera sp.]|uniref:type I-G CRISPR-associated helicase/endonuclease Cas3g n=1 Tax=Thauera sp. TaxID=1905334 RepID=UPI00261EB0F2|nr:type I-U CRISPR-associated helicase/endonuclease Cas3 [Thauera sp.]MCP5224745.1 type I-U CRISPR-associated helicase/endonuclease Cas3 [Thauera sp.]
MNFASMFQTLTGHAPMRWQQRLYGEHFAKGELPSAISVPTGLGKTAVMAIWLVSLAEQMKARGKPELPRRLIYVVDRRAVVDQATKFAETLRKNLGKPEIRAFADALGLENGKLPISTLRGQFVDNREWLEDPSKPAIIVGTVDMIGSRLLFEGYGVSRKMRPYHAGLLGADTLVVLDEAHLVPPFEALLAEIADNAGRYGPRREDLGVMVPRFRLLPLSATGRRPTATPFTLAEKDFRNPDEPIAIERLFARKRLVLKEIRDQKLADAMADHAWALAQGENNVLQPVRILVYCDSREVAQSVGDALHKRAKGTVAADRTALFVGARRVKERIDAERGLQALGFLADNHGQRDQPSFLVATSAGEVGVDLDADHMVCDLVAWERMVQRFGRVNRRGGEDRQAEVVVLVETAPKKATDEALERIRAQRAPFGEALREGDDGRFDVSPEALRQLSEQARMDDRLLSLIADAGSPMPLRPALNRALVDAWSMTSLPEHTGRPEIEPWLRGWVQDEPQTIIVWRKNLPVRATPAVSGRDIEDYFEAAPIHSSETLETETFRVMGWLRTRAGKLREALQPSDVTGIVLTADGRHVQSFRIGDFLEDQKSDKKRQEEVAKTLSGRTLVIDAGFGGLKDGLLNGDFADAPIVADDSSNCWIATDDGKPLIRFRICERTAQAAPDPDSEIGNVWRENLRFDLEHSATGEATRWLSIQKWRDTSNNENDRAEGRPQSLAEHQSWTAVRANAIGERLALPAQYIRTVSIAARLHDEGKRGRNWKRAFHVEHYANKLGIPGQPLAKTPRFNWALLDGYRHEFGSLPYAKDDPEVKSLPEELQDLALHLIAAHHGNARPLIATRGCDDAPPSVLEERAREVALRYARLQQRWGPWGLAWWEALLRAADAQASRANDEGEND